MDSDYNTNFGKELCVVATFFQVSTNRYKDSRAALSTPR